ncbi:ankyrin repeat, SAM and basic leucine zipper domain-containing protein 1 [Salarias fasciatus]|uniref:ankyrin repeat, SAM and basic leucine zipper domain-containing protein 1 n=1 Tax=Salarias fasciatus TaxID=181472 RepID=UPI0011765B76|nr:ankyrin repeat, SAM and basic leucine zipper domain-containing protein 1 [Salarias fasciatus]
MEYFHAIPAGQESDSGDDFDMGDQLHENSAELIQAEDTEDTLRMKAALMRGDTKTVAQLLDKGMDVETGLACGWTPLMYSVSAVHCEMTKLLLDRGASANSSKEDRTALMMCCTASATEDSIASCMELLLTRNADPNVVDRSGTSCLMMAARNGHSSVVNLLVSRGADIDLSNGEGYTALSVAVQYNRVEVVLKLLQLGADQTIRTRAGKSAALLAAELRRTQISRILSSSLGAGPDQDSREELLSRFLNSSAPSSAVSANKLSEVELLLHGLQLGHLVDVLNEHDVTWSDLVSMNEDDLQKVGIGDPSDQQKVLSTVKLMTLDQVDLDTISQLDTSTLGSEDLQNFLLGVSQQCCSLTEVLQDTIRHFPQQASQLVFSLDPKKEARALCRQLIVQASDLQKEATCLHNLLCQMADSTDAGLPGPGPGPAPRGRSLTRVAVTMLASASVLLLLCRAAGGNAGCFLSRSLH